MIPWDPKKWKERGKYPDVGDRKFRKWPLKKSKSIDLEVENVSSIKPREKVTLGSNPRERQNRTQGNGNGGMEAVRCLGVVFLISTDNKTLAD